MKKVLFLRKKESTVQLTLCGLPVLDLREFINLAKRTCTCHECLSFAIVAADWGIDNVFELANTTVVVICVSNTLCDNIHFISSFVNLAFCELTRLTAVIQSIKFEGIVRLTLEIFSELRKATYINI